VGHVSSTTMLRRGPVLLADNHQMFIDDNYHGKESNENTTIAEPGVNVITVYKYQYNILNLGRSS
jgi:hypothetical protein